MIIYISNQNNHGIGHTKKLLHARTRKNFCVYFVPKDYFIFLNIFFLWLGKELPYQQEPMIKYFYLIKYVKILDKHKLFFSLGNNGQTHRREMDNGFNHYI